MWHFPWFWMALFAFWLMMSRRRRWHRWHRRGWEREALRETMREELRRELRGETLDRERPPAARPAPDPSYVEQLETRIAQLEERLDFTERLLEGRRETAARS